MKKVLITGASGFVGYNTLKLLVQKGYEVHALTRNSRREGFIENVHWYSLDIFDIDSLNNIMLKIKPTSIIHFAWNATPGEYANSEENLTWVTSSIELLKLFKKYGGKRFVFAGTCFEYDLKYGFLTEETTPSIPYSLYGVCKYSFESIALEYCKRKNISFASGRIFYLYGERENQNRIIPYVINCLLKNEIVNCTDGTQIRDFMHVEDVARAFVSILESKIEGVVNVGSGEPVKLSSIILKIAEKFNKKELIKLGSINNSSNEPYMIVANNHILKNETDWVQRISIDDGLGKVIEWWRSRYINK